MKKITAADLLRLGFNRVDVPKEESGDEDYFYFIFDVEGKRFRPYSILITNDEDNKDDSYSVEINELDDAVVIKDLDDLELLVGIIRRNVKK